MSALGLGPLLMPSGTGGSVGGDESTAGGGPGWFQKAKVRPPECPKGYVSRPSLAQRLGGALQRRLTVLQAPAGFGKTSLLADVARHTREEGVVVAWISLDNDDSPKVFGSYLAYAFGQGGLDLGVLGTQDSWSSSPAAQQMGMVARAIELHAAPCLLVLDEVERLPQRTVRLVDELLKRAPRNLHIAIAFRSNPGVDVTTHVLQDMAIVVSTEELRFSRSETSRFFAGSLSRAELAMVEERAIGWPFALMVYRNTGVAEAGTSVAGAAQLAESYIGVSLLRDLSREDRRCLFDLAVFDWIEANLVDSVLGSSDARVRVDRLPALNGFLSPVEGDDPVRRLHPLLREYCLDALSVEDPDRKRALHRRIALELARRGHMTPTWRHASASGDIRLVAELIERFGAFELWMREGGTRLLSANRFLTPEVTEPYPRLDLLRCTVLCLTSKREEAAALLEAVSRRTDGFTRDRDGGDAEALAVDRVFAQAVLVGGTSELSPDDLDSWLPAGGSVDSDEEQDRALASARHTLFCIAHYGRANFVKSRQHGLQVQAHFGRERRFGEVLVNVCLGMSAMVRGDVEEASERYQRARKVVRKRFASDPCVAVSTDVLVFELDLERNRARQIRQRTLKRLTQLPSVWVEVYSTAIAVSAELMFEQYGSKAVLQLVSQALENARASGIESLLNNMSALYAYYLVEVGRSPEAAQAWSDHGLPCGVTDLVDLDRQSWRTMEALSCARVRLLLEQGEFAAAEELACRLCDTASAHDLTRTLLRGLALSMVVAHREGDAKRAKVRLTEFLRVLRDVDYVRPLVRHRNVSLPVLKELLGTDPSDEIGRVAEFAFEHVRKSGTATAPVFSSREIDVLAGIGNGLRNKEIASRLGITDEGVRYHLRNIYRKTGATNRAEALRCAKSLGVLT